jgi:hypothetical protein
MTGQGFPMLFLPPAAAGRRGGCEDTSRSGKGLAALCNPFFGEHWKALVSTLANVTLPMIE